MEPVTETAFYRATQDYGLLDCRNENLVATQLRIQVDMGMEDGYDIERFVELEEGDCGEGRGAVFGLKVTGEGGWLWSGGSRSGWAGPAGKSKSLEKS